MTDSQPKCYVPISGWHIRDWTVDAFQGVSIHMVIPHGDYMAIDTEEDYTLTNEQWRERNE